MNNSNLKNDVVMTNDRKPKLKCELYRDSFQNYKGYSIPPCTVDNC